MNIEQQKIALYRAEEHINNARRSAWDIIELSNPENDSINLDRKLKEAKKSFRELERSIESTKNYLEGILIEVKK